MSKEPTTATTTSVTRREWLALSGGALATAAAASLPSASWAQAPKRGGTLSLRLWDPPHWDPQLQISYKTHTALTFTHSRLVKHKAGSGVQPGSFPIEGDLAESWTQPNENTYVFKLRRGVRWHAKPPVNGRELTADDVVYSMERFRTVKGNANAYMLASVDKVEALDKYTVRFTLKEPFVWFLDVLANPMAACIVAKEAVEKFGDLKKWEAVIGTGPWMLDSYRPNVGFTYVRHPNYFVAGLPHIDKIEAVVDEDNASRMAAFLAGKYDLGWENPGTINRVDWVQIKDVLKQRRPGLRTLESPSNVMSHIYMRTDKAPFSDVRVRRAMSLAINRQQLIDSTFEGVGAYNPPVPAALRDWAIPFDQLGEGGQWYKHDPAAARKLLAEAGLSSGFSAALDFTTYSSTVLVDQNAAHPQGPQDGGHRRQAEPERIRRLYLHHLLRQVRRHGLRPPDALPRSGQLPVRPVLPGRDQEPRPHQRPRGRRHARPTAPHPGSGQAPRGHLRYPAVPRQAAVLGADAFGRLRLRLGRRRQELLTQSGL
jgi:ABC-type transport system substrate-binding protein